MARALIAILLAAAFVAPGGVAAGPCANAAAATGAENRAGLVVQMPDDTLTFCVEFTAEEAERGFTGADLLRRAGIPVVFGGTTTAATVCRIGDVGCTDTVRCFCECPVATSPDCRFWGYYNVGSDGTWSFSQAGATDRKLRDGDVDGWRYANHATGAAPPPPTSLETICAAGVQRTAAPNEAVRNAGAAGLVAAGAAAAAFVIGFAVTMRRRKAAARDGAGE